MLKESCLFLFLFVAATSGMVCWRCGNTRNMMDCKLRGRFDTCSSDQGMCVTEVRKSGGRMTVNKGCKQTQACKNMRKQNYMRDGKTTQCNRSGRSVCCCCCGNKACNMKTMCQARSKKRRPMKTPRQSRSKSPVVRPQKPNIPTKKPYVPKRARFPMCPLFGKDFSHGSMKCSTPKERRGMVCDFKCTEEGYQLFPRHDQTLVCMPNGKWSHPKPCCGMACGPPKYDIIAMVHASDNETYETMHEVFHIMLRRLVKNPTDIRHSVVEFSGNVTYNTDLDEYDEDEDYHQDLIDRGYNNTGDGNVNIGVALEAVHYLYGSQSNSDNRNNVKDVILLATDSDSDDAYLEAGKIWKDEDAMILVMSFPKNGTYPSDPNLTALTKESHHVIKYRKGRIPDMAYFIADDLADHSCVNPCNKAHDVHH